MMSFKNFLTCRNSDFRPPILKSDTNLVFFIPVGLANYSIEIEFRLFSLGFIPKILDSKI